jgi:hypothetical protein
VSSTSLETPLNLSVSDIGKSFWRSAGHKSTQHLRTTQHLAMFYPPAPPPAIQVVKSIWLRTKRPRVRVPLGAQKQACFERDGPVCFKSTAIRLLYYQHDSLNMIGSLLLARDVSLGSFSQPHWVSARVSTDSILYDASIVLDIRAHSCQTACVPSMLIPPTLTLCNGRDGKHLAERQMVRYEDSRQKRHTAADRARVYERSTAKV